MVRHNKRRSARPRATRRGRSRISRGGGGSNVQPPAFRPTLSLTHKFRFVATNASGGISITRKNLLNLIQMATSASTTVRILEGVRLKSVEMWGQPTALGAAPVTLEIEWIGENSPSTVVSDTSMGVRPAHVRSRPPASSSNRWWSLSGNQETDPLFNMSYPANTYVDVIADLRFVEQEGPTAGDVPAGAVLGTLYGNYLDGITTGLLAPVGYNVLP